MAKTRPAPDEPPEKYIAASGRLLYAGGDRLWIVDPVRGRVLEAPEEAGPILRIADRFRTLREHRKALLELGWQDDGSGSLDALLSSLVRSGALLARRELLRRLQEAAPEPPPPPVSAIAWVTRGRPALLCRSVESAVASLRLYGRRAELRVYDDSAEARTRQETRAMLSELGRREGRPVYYAGAEEKREFAAALRARAGGMSAENIEFALFDPLGIGYTPGSNGNAMLLDTCGKLILHADDDTVFRFASLPGADAGLRLSSAADPTEARFFADAREREEAAGLRDVDILTAHEALLGRSVADCLRQHGGDADCGEASPEYLSLLQAGDAKVAATMAGVCGDSGLGSPLFVLWLSGASRELAFQSEQSYRSALRSRQVIRAASRTTLGSSAFLMSMHLGLDNRLTLPPFLPVLRNEDGLFGQMLKSCQPSGLTAYLPLAVAHLPDEARSSTGKDLWRGRARAADLLIELFRYIIRTGACRSPEQELRSLGEQLGGVAGLPAPEFRALSRQAWAESRSRYIMALEQLLAEHGREPSCWAADAEAWIRAAQEEAAAEGPLVPEDLQRQDQPDEAAALLQQLFLRYGELLEVWPVIRQAAGELAREGRGLAVPL